MGWAGRPDATTYQTSKGAATMLGYVEPGEAAGTFAQGIPLCGRLAEPADVANAALFLVSPDSAYIGGVTLPAEDGSSA